MIVYMGGFSIEVKRRKDVLQIKKEIAMKTKELFAQKGYSATSMEEICAINNRSKGSIYYHFKSKEELFMFLIRINNEEWIDSWQEIEQQYETAIDKLSGLADYYVDDLASPLNHAINEFLSAQVVSKEMMDEMLSLIRLPYKTYENIIMQGIEQGELKPGDPRELMYIINGLFNGLSTLYFEMEIDELRQLFHKGLRVILQGIQQTKQ